MSVKFIKNILLMIYLYLICLITCLMLFNYLIDISDGIVELYKPPKLAIPLSLTDQFGQYERYKDTSAEKLEEIRLEKIKEYRVEMPMREIDEKNQNKLKIWKSILKALICTFIFFPHLYAVRQVHLSKKNEN